MSLEEGMAAAREWLKRHYEIEQIKTFDGFAVVLARHLGNTPGTQNIRGRKLFACVETEQSMRGPVAERHAKLAKSVGVFSVIVPGEYLHVHHLRQPYISIIQHYGSALTSSQK